MFDHKYVALDVHQATIHAQVQNPQGKTLIKSIIETNAELSGERRRVRSSDTLEFSTFFV